MWGCVVHGSFICLLNVCGHGAAGPPPPSPSSLPNNQQHGGTQDCEERVLAHLRNSSKHQDRGDDEFTEAVGSGDANIVSIEVQNRWVPAEVLGNRTPSTPPRAPLPTSRPNSSAPLLALQHHGPSSSSVVVLPSVQKKRKIAALIQEVKGTQETVDNASHMFELALHAFKGESERLANIMQQLQELS